MPFNGGCGVSHSSNYDKYGSVRKYITAAGASTCNLADLKKELNECMQVKNEEHGRLNMFSKWASHYIGQKEKVDRCIVIINSKMEPEAKRNKLQKLALNFCDIYPEGRIRNILGKAYVQLHNNGVNDNVMVSVNASVEMMALKRVTL